MTTLQSPELLVDAKTDLGEGAVWDAATDRLLWVDIHGGTVYAYDPIRRENRAYPVGEHVGTVVPRRSGGALVALVRSISALDFNTGKLVQVAEPPGERPNTRFNDGKCDPEGRFWAGTMAYDFAAGAGTLYCLEPDLRIRRALERVSLSNGLVWSLDARTMYYIDSTKRSVDAFDYARNTGSLSNRRTVVTIAPEHGMPDGMAIDAEGMLWVAHWGGWKVARWDPRSGKLVSEIRLPVSQVTSCAFGGQDLDVLYITSARYKLDPEALRKEPLAGGLFAVPAPVRGVVSPAFAG